MSNSASSDVNWEMWKAIGTLLASYLALTFGLRDVIERWWNRPKIVLEQQVTLDKSFCQYNLKITNKGKTTAQNINVKIERILQEGTPIRSGSFPYPLNNATHLQNEDYRFIRLLMVTQNPNSMEIGQESWYIDRHNSIFDILVTGDNITATRYSFRYIDATELSQIQLQKS